MQRLQQENGSLHGHLCKQHSHYFLVFKYLLGEPSTVCWWLLCLAPEPPASQRHLAFTWKEESATDTGGAGLACALVQGNVLPSEIPAGQSSTRKSSWSPGVSTTAPAQGLALLQEEIAQLWNILASGFPCHSLAACSQCSAFQSELLSCPCVCTSWSRAGIVVKAVFYCSFVLRIMACGFAVEFQVMNIKPAVW